MVRLNEIERTDVNEALSPSEVTRIKKLLRTYFNLRQDGGLILTIVVDHDGKVNINGHCVHKTNMMVEKLPVSFGMVSGDFDIRQFGLDILEGCPTSVGGNFFCELNHIGSLKGGPEYVGGYYFCRHNEIISLEGLPEHANPLVITYRKDLSLLRLITIKYSVDLQSDQGFNRPLEKVKAIIEKYKGKGIDRMNILACQKELIDNGFEGNASW